MFFSGDLKIVNCKKVTREEKEVGRKDEARHTADMKKNVNYDGNVPHNPEKEKKITLNFLSGKIKPRRN